MVWCVSSGAPAGWYPVEGDPRLRWWDGTQWTEHFWTSPTSTSSVRAQTAGIVAAAQGAAARAAQGAADRAALAVHRFPESATWSATGRPITGIGGGRFWMDDKHLFFERGVVRTDSQQVPLAQIIDVDVKQTIAQKVRDVFTLRVRIQRVGGVELVLIEDIPDGRGAQRAINSAAHEARLAATRTANTHRFEGTTSAASSPAAAPDVSKDVASQLRTLMDLHAAGLLSDEEFQSKRAEVLARL